MKEIVVRNADKWSKKKAPHISNGVLYMVILTIYYITIVFLDCMHFSYTLAHCLFDAFHIPLHFQYSSIELGNQSINHFLVCLDNIGVDAL